MRRAFSMHPTGLHISRLALALSLVAGAGCDLPVEVGDDLPGDAPSANLGPQIDTGADITAPPDADISGRFDLTARLTSDLGGGTVVFRFVARPEQSGSIGAGATVELELRPPSAPDEPGARTEGPAPVDSTGAFRATVTGYTVPAEASEMLEAETDADVELDAQIVDSHCFRGEATLTLRDVQVSGSTVSEIVFEGPFEAVRTGETCGGDSSPGGDVGTGDASDAGA